MVDNNNPNAPPKFSKAKRQKDNPFLSLAPQPEPICATEPRLVLPHSVTLLISGSRCIGGDRFKLKCANTGVPYFRCQERFLSGKKILWDSSGTAILNLKETHTLTNITIAPYQRTYIVFQGDNSSKTLFKIRKSGSMFRSKVTVDFQDICTGRMRHLVLKCRHFGQNLIIIYSGDPKKDGVPIAKLFTCGTYLPKEHYLEIAPEVDIALIVAMCIAAVGVI